MSLIEHYRAMARNNAWSNHRLGEACCRLTPEAFAARRTSFFPSLAATLNHLLTIDWYYLDALEGGGRGLAVLDPELPHPRAAALRDAQAATDRRLIAFCDALDGPALARFVPIDRGREGIRPETVDATLAHLFVHQIHHRGQAHAMLAGTDVPPPQLDEFFLAYDAPRRTRELSTLGLSGSPGAAPIPT